MRLHKPKVVELGDSDVVFFVIVLSCCLKVEGAFLLIEGNELRKGFSIGLPDKGFGVQFKSRDALLVHVA